MDQSTEGKQQKQNYLFGINSLIVFQEKAGLDNVAKNYFKANNSICDI